MTRYYDSYVLRCWQVNDRQRIEVEHLQSGARTHADTFGAVLAWIDNNCDRPAARDAVVGSAESHVEEVTNSEDLSADAGRTR